MVPGLHHDAVNLSIHPSNNQHIFAVRLNSPAGVTSYILEVLIFLAVSHLVFIHEKLHV